MDEDTGIFIMIIVVLSCVFVFGIWLGDKIGESRGMANVALHVCKSAGYQYATVKEIDDKIEIFCYNETPLYEEGGGEK